MTHYVALIHKEADSGYGISFPDVLGITTIADSLDDALREASTVLAFAFEDWQGDLPIPRTLDELRRDPEFLAWSRDAVVTAVAPAVALADAA